MRLAARIGLVVVGIVALGIAAAFLRGVPEAVALWPYPLTYGLGRVFIASMLAAVGAPVVWIGMSGDLAALRPGALNIAAVSVGLGAQAGWKIAGGASSTGLVVLGVGTWALVGAMAVLFALTRTVPWRDERPTPWLVRLAFALFVVLLIIAGGLLLLGVQVFPWVLDRDTAIAYGAMFLGAATYFVYGLVVPVWSNAKGQLLGFLAYDLVLVVPYLRLWPATAGDQRLGLAVYIAAIVASGTIAIWFLFFNPIWRFGRKLRRRPVELTGEAF